MWRPDNWDNPYTKPVREGVKWNKEVKEAFEAGADAILEALKKQGRYYPTERKYLIDHQPGWIVFIPGGK